MPEGLDIDFKSNLNGVISGYADQVLVCTGRDDWTSRIEDECDGDNLAADLKELFGRGGRYSDVSVLSPVFTVVYTVLVDFFLPAYPDLFLRDGR